MSEQLFPSSTVAYRRHEVLQGLKLSAPAGMGMFPLGVAFGLLVVQSGLPWWMAPALSIFVYAGSLELLLIALIVAGTPLATIALASLLVNFRHIFYAFNFPLKVLKNPAAKAYAIYALTDETYAVTSAHPQGWTPWRLLSLQIFLQVYWVGGGLVGVAVGAFIPQQLVGLEFALCALFITLTLDAWRTRRQTPSALLAGISYTTALLLTPDTALFTGLILFVLTLVVRYLFHPKMRQRLTNRGQEDA